MIFKNETAVKKINKHISYKLCNLLSFLSHTTYEYGKVAEEIDDKDMKMALISIAAETNQYAAELSAQLKCLDIPYLSGSQDFNRNDISAYIYSLSKPDEKNISSICDENEHFLITAYQEVLEEAIPFPFVKQMIAQQLTGVKGAFMKVRLMDLLQLKEVN